jgi:hypothetical protein
MPRNKSADYSAVRETMDKLEAGIEAELEEYTGEVPEWKFTNKLVMINNFLWHEYEVPSSDQRFFWAALAENGNVLLVTDLEEASVYI